MPSVCRNCGASAPLRYCPACGQAVEDRRGPLFALLGEFFTEFFSLDGRHLRTAFTLLRPGKLTVLYLEGKRASYAAPVRVYFVASLLFFLFVGFPAPNADEFNVWVDDDLIGREEVDPSLGNINLSLARTGWIAERLEDSLNAKREQLMAMPAQELVDRFFASLERTVPTALIFFVPVLALALKLLYLRQRFFYVDHLVAALHFQSFLFLALLMARVANSLGLTQLLRGFVAYLAVLVLVAPFYLLFAVKRVYGQSWGWTVFKTGALGLLYLLIIQPIFGVTLYFAIRGI